MMIMKNLQKIIAVVLVCLTINAMGIFGGCGKSEVTSTPPEEPAHVHHYISKDTYFSSPKLCKVL